MSLIHALGGRLVDCFIDVGLGGSLFLCAGTLWRNGRVLALGRVLVGVAFWAFGILHFAFPAFAPGIPPRHETVRFPLPYHDVWVYATGAVFVVGGLCLILNRETRLAAMCLFVLVVVFGLITWISAFVATPMHVAGDWLEHVGDAVGLVILMAVSDPGRSAAPAVATPPPHGDRRSPAAQG